MPHTITGEIRKEVYTKEGSGNKGPWKMYAVELSESYKDKDGARQYTNYRATFFASEAQKNWYDHAFVQGKVISATCEQLSVQQREHNGTNYITLELIQPRLVFSQREPAQGQQSGEKSGWGAPQQPQGSNQFSGGQKSRPAAQSNAQSQGNEPPMDFDDDIPF